MRKNIILTPPYLILFSTFFLALTGCEDILKVDSPTSKIESKIAFDNDMTATSAITGIYSNMMDISSFASGSFQSITSIAGFSSDELHYYPTTDVSAIDINRNKIHPTNPYILSLWSSTYNSIYHANACIEGLSASNSIKDELKSQLEGEARFVRAFGHFYLVNLFGDVPIATSTDYRINSVSSRKAVGDVYNFIVQDLILAQELLSDSYPTSERIRPNKATATALLARVYLYLKEWEKAEIEATKIINSPLYSLDPDLNGVFLANSSEAIWQLKQVLPNLNTQEGYFFILDTTPQFGILSSQLLSAFEPEDNRFESWVGQYVSGDQTFFFPYKYKVKYGSPLIEYSMVFRLAEIYLIRSESRVRQSKIPEAIQDIDKIRTRAGLEPLEGTLKEATVEELLDLVLHERQIELFTEWGHRWFDLKRTQRSDLFLPAIKSEWDINDTLYPVPQSEFNRNPKLGDQNLGY